MWVVVPVRIPPATVERGVSNEVVDPVFFVDGVLVEVHSVFVGVQPIAAAPSVVLVGTRMLAPVLVERDCLVGCSRGRKHPTRDDTDCKRKERGSSR